MRAIKAVALSVVFFYGVLFALVVCSLLFQFIR